MVEAPPHIVAERQAANQAGMSVPALRIVAAALGTGPAEYGGLRLRTQKDVAAHFGVTLRAVGNWRADGMPGAAGDYRPAKIAAWRKVRYDSPVPNPNHPPRQATGEALTAAFRALRLHITQAANDALTDFLEALQPAPDVQPSLEAAFLMAIDKHFDQFRLSDHEIERVLQEVWSLV